MLAFARTCEAVAATTRKTEKVRLVAEYLHPTAPTAGASGTPDLKPLPLDEVAVAALFLSGRPFPAWEETTLQVGGSLVWQAVKEVSKTSDAELVAAYRRHGDLGAATCEVLTSGESAVSSAGLSLLEVERNFRIIASTRGPAAKTALLVALLRRAAPLEAKYLVKLMTGELRIGLRESLVEDAIAQAFGAEARAVQRANMLLGSLADALRLAAAGKLGQARMRLFHPIGFMLASPAENAEEACGCFQQAQVEDKYDGIRAQAHVGESDGAKRARLFSRTLDEVTESFPELPPALEALPAGVILDGEIVAWSWEREPEAEPAHPGGRALPFSELQKRLGRKRVTRAVIEEVPVAYVVFDVLYAEGELTIDRPLHQRAAVLDRVFAAPRSAARVPVEDPQGKLAFEPVPRTPDAAGHAREVIRAPAARAASPRQLEELFERALERGNEGLMIKDLDSSYTPGRRGRSWLKLKRELATLDVVVTAVEYGHGKRVHVLSDYTFAVRDGRSDRLLNVGKAYSGLTDVEIAELTQWFLEHTLEDRGRLRIVDPKIVLEVAFNAVMRSDRHESGYALRFPRIVRLRPDKPPGEIDTLERVREIYERQKLRESA